jgi:hypothetical protein
MALRRVGVRQGNTHAALLAALLLVSACSSDSSVSFDPNPNVSGHSGSGGQSEAGTGHGSSGSGNRAGSSSEAGSGTGEGGRADGGSAGTGTSGSSVGGSGISGSGHEGGYGGGSGGSGNAGEPTAGSAGSGGGGADGIGGQGGGAGSGGMGGSYGGGGDGGSGGAGGNPPCTSGLFNGKSYAFCGVVDSATAALAKCESLDMAMVSIESKAENTYVQSKQSSTWLGGSDEDMEGEWRWVRTGVLFWKEKPLLGVYSNFVEGQPSNKDNAGEPENCLVLTASGWNDVGCALGGFKVTCESGGLISQP